MNKPIIEINGPSAALTQTLLNGELIAYHDNQYEVTTRPHELLMKLFHKEERFVIFYLQVPYAYPIPDGLKTTLKMAFEAAMEASIPNMEFINAGTEAQKRDMHFRIQLAGELGEDEHK